MDPVCSTSAVKMQAGVKFGGSKKHVLAAAGMARAANEMGAEALCGGNWKKQQKSVERRLKNAAREEIRAEMGFIATFFMSFILKAVLAWFVDQYLGA